MKSLKLFLIVTLYLHFSSVSAENFIKHLEKDQTSPPANIEQLKWIAGHWQGEAFGGKTEEIWSPPKGGSMMASFRLIVEGKVRFYELEIIREVNDSLILELKHFSNELKGWESKNEVISFPLVKIEKNIAYFDGMTFQKVDKDNLNIYVSIEGKEVLFSYESKSEND